MALWLSVEQHVYALEHETVGLPSDAQEALHAEDVNTALTQDFTQPCIEAIGIHIACALDRKGPHLVVVLMLSHPDALNLDIHLRAIIAQNLHVKLLGRVLCVEPHLGGLIDREEEGLSTGVLEAAG